MESSSQKQMVSKVSCANTLYNKFHFVTPTIPSSLPEFPFIIVTLIPFSYHTET